MDRAGSPSRLVFTIFAQSLLYGAFFVISVLNYWALVFRRSCDPHFKKALFGLSSLMLVLATLHIISSLSSALAELKWNASNLHYLLPISNSVLCVLQTLVADSIGIYRCWIVLGRRRFLVALPFLLLLGSIAAGIEMLFNLAGFIQGSLTIHNLRLWTFAFFSTSLATSMVCTFIIVTRIWFLLPTKRSRSISSFILILLESGALYSGILIILLILLATNSWFQYVLIEALPSIIGILFSIILIRIGLGLSIDGPQPSSPTSSWSPPSTKSHYSKSSNPPKYLNDPITSSSPSAHFHRPLILPLILSQNQEQKGQIEIDQIQQQQQQQQHYNLRSQLPQPSSYFRTSEDIEIDIELEFEIDEARYKNPKPLPINPPSKIYTPT